MWNKIRRCHPVYCYRRRGVVWLNWMCVKCTFVHWRQIWQNSPITCMRRTYQLGDVAGLQMPNIRKNSWADRDAVWGGQTRVGQRNPDPPTGKGYFRGHAPDTPPTMDAFNLCTVRTYTNSTQQGRHAKALRAVDTNWSNSWSLKTAILYILTTQKRRKVKYCRGRLSVSISRLEYSTQYWRETDVVLSTTLELEIML